MNSEHDKSNEEKHFVEFRRKVRAAEVLSAAMEKLLRAVQFSGRVTVVVQNGRVLKSGYEEGYFRQHGDSSRRDDDIMCNAQPTEGGY
jgi:hypothetical protein